MAAMNARMEGAVGRDRSRTLLLAPVRDYPALAAALAGAAETVLKRSLGGDGLLFQFRSPRLRGSATRLPDHLRVYLQRHGSVPLACRSTDGTRAKLVSRAMNLAFLWVNVQCNALRRCVSFLRHFTPAAPIPVAALDGH